MYILWTITFGLYGLYWFVKTKNNMNQKGAKIPTAWLMVIPLVNVYWLYKYAEGFAVKLQKDKHSFVWFLVFFFIPILTPLLVQLKLNKIAKKTASSRC